MSTRTWARARIERKGDSRLNEIPFHRLSPLPPCWRCAWPTIRESHVNLHTVVKIAENPFVFFVSSLSPSAFSRKENNISNRTTRENVEKVDNPNIDQVWISIYIFFSLFLRRNYDKGGEDRIDGNIKRRGGQGF